MSLSFKRRVGANADVKELEYIIALHQTCMPSTRDNATVSSVDVLRLLRSRYGLKISHAKAIEIVRGLGGSDVVAAEQDINTSKGLLSPLLHRKKDAGQAEQEAKKSDANIDSESQDFEHSWGIPFIKGTWKSPASKVKDSEQFAERASEEDEDSRVNIVTEDTGSGVEIDRHSHKVEAEEMHAEEKKTTGVSRNDSDTDLPEQYLDLVQILSILLIPAMARAADEYRNGPREQPAVPEPSGYFLSRPFRTAAWKLLQRIAKKMHSNYEGMRPLPDRSLAKVLVQLFLQDTRECQLDEKLVESLLLRYGEIERADNPALIREMIEAAQSSSGCLDEEALFSALTGDLQDWDSDSVTRVSTHFEDVFGMGNPTKVKQIEAEDLIETENDEEDPKALSGSSTEARNIHTGTGVVSNASSRPVISTGSTGFEGQTTYCRCGRIFGCVRTLFSCCCSWYFKSNKGPFMTEQFDIDMVLDAHFSLWTIVAIWIFYVAR